MDCRLPDYSVHGNYQARILEWIAISFSRESSWSRDWTWVSCIAGGFFYWLSYEESTISLPKYNTNMARLMLTWRNISQGMLEGTLVYPVQIKNTYIWIKPIRHLNQILYISQYRMSNIPQNKSALFIKLNKSSYI